MSLVRAAVPMLLMTAMAAAQVLTFSSSIDTPAGLLAAVGDLTADGRAEAVCLVPGGIEIYVANRNGTFAPKATEPLQADSAGLFDFNGDGTIDPVFVHRPVVACSGLIGAGLNLGGCAGAGPGIAFAPFVQPITTSGCFAGPERLLFDGQRLWIWEPMATRVWWFDVTPAATFGGAPTLTPAGFWFPNCGVIRDLALCDLDGDPHLDVVMACSGTVTSTTSTVHTFLGSATGPVVNPGSAPIGLPGIPSMAVVDVDGDNRDDIVAAVAGGVGMLSNLGPAGGGVAFGFFGLWAGDAISVAPGDFDGDGDEDIGIARASQLISFLINDGAGVYTPDGVDLPTSPAPLLDTGDLNGDGCDDVITTGGAGGMRTWLSTWTPLVEPRPGTADGVQLETCTGVGSPPASGPLGAIKHAMPGTFLSASIVGTPALGGSPVVIGVEVYPTGCPPIPASPEIWVSSTMATVTVWDVMPASGTYVLVVGVPASLPVGISGLIQAGVVTPLALNGAAIATPAHEVQF